MNVVDTGEADRFRNDAWMAGRKVRCMISPEAAAEDAEIVAPRRRLNEGDHLVAQIPVVLRVALRSQRRRNLFVIPALGIHRIDAEELNEPLLDLVGQPAHGIHVFVLIVAPHRRRKHDDPESPVAESKKLHGPLQRSAHPRFVSTHHWEARTPHGCEVPGFRS